MAKIGYLVTAYPEKRCVIDKVAGFEYIFLDKRKNSSYLSNGLLYKLGLKKVWDAVSMLSVNSNKVDVIHTVNTVLKTTNNWVTTFETAVPRTNFTCDKNKRLSLHPFDKLTKTECLELCRENCLRILAMSECAYNIQKRLISHSGLHRDMITKILQKTEVLLPPQDILVSENEIKSKYENLNKLTFIFIGNDFFRKGGVELIDVLSKFEKEYSFKLIIISNLSYGDYATNASVEEKQSILKIMEKKSWIDFRGKIPNEEVLGLVKTAHVGLLPTYAETFGFSVLEMQAAGIPVITTDIRALTEINNSVCGWLCHLKQDQNKEVSYPTVEEMRNDLKCELFRVLKQVFDDWEHNKCLEKSLRSLERIKKFHDPYLYGKHLQEIYAHKI